MVEIEAKLLAIVKFSLFRYFYCAFQAVSSFLTIKRARYILLLKIFSVSLCADHDVAINRYSRLSKRRENDKVTAFRFTIHDFIPQTIH